MSKSRVNILIKNGKALLGQFRSSNREDIVDSRKENFR